MLKCRLYDDYRLTLFTKIVEILPDCSSLAEPNKFVFLLTNKDSRILTWVGKFIFESFIKRDEYHSES